MSMLLAQAGESSQKLYLFALWVVLVAFGGLLLGLGVIRLLWVMWARSLRKRPSRNHTPAIDPWQESARRLKMDDDLLDESDLEEDDDSDGPLR